MAIGYDKNGNIIEIYGIDGSGGGGGGEYTLPVATTTRLGGVKIDGETIQINNGVIKANLDELGNEVNALSGRVTTLEETKAVNIQLYFDGSHIYRENGGEQLNYTQIYNIISEETNNVSVNYANSNVLYPSFWTGDAVEFTNILMIDDKTYSTRLIINAQNQISYDEEDLTSGGGSYTLPTASTTTLGGVKIDGSTITIDNGVISATADTSNLANKDLSNLTANGKLVIDGQWIKSGTVLLNGVTFNASESKIIDLSSIIPNDGYSYEIIVSGYGRGNGTAGKITDIGIGDDTQEYTSKNVRIFACQSASGTVVGFGAGACIIPIKSRSLNVYNTQSNTTGSVGVTLQAYRRIGTNN